MCFFALIKFLLKFILPIAIIALVIYLVYFNNQAPDETIESLTYLNLLK